MRDAWTANHAKPPPAPAPYVPPPPLPCRGLWVSDGFQPEVGRTVDELLSDLGTMRATSCFFQANAGGWFQAYADVRKRGYDVQLWASCSQIEPERLRSLLATYKPSRFVAQVEGLAEFNAFRAFIAAGVFDTYNRDVVIIGPVTDAYPALPQDDRAGAFGSELRSLGVGRTWCEAYLQDNPPRDPLGMTGQARQWWNCPDPQAVMGFYGGVGPSAYPRLPIFSAWRFEEMADHPDWLWQLA